MKKIHSFIFYSLYNYFIKIGRKDIPERKAVVILSLWESLYLLIPFGLVRYFTSIDLRFPTPVVGGLCLLICIINFYYWVYTKRCLRIYRDLKKDIEFNRKYGVIIPSIFFLIPILTPIVFAFTIWS